MRIRVVQEDTPTTVGRIVGRRISVCDAKLTLVPCPRVALFLPHRTDCGLTLAGASASELSRRVLPVELAQVAGVDSRALVFLVILAPRWGGGVQHSATWTEPAQ